VTTLPADGFLATDVLDLSQGRGACEGTLADEDQEGDPDRWCSLTACGQECWHIVWQWVWNLRLACSAGCAQTPCASWSGRLRMRRRALYKPVRSRLLVKRQCMDRLHGPERAAGG
jgi:hypothetical protein